MLEAFFSCPGWYKSRVFYLNREEMTMRSMSLRELLVTQVRLKLHSFNVWIVILLHNCLRNHVTCYLFRFLFFQLLARRRHWNNVLFYSSARIMEVLKLVAVFQYTTLEAWHDIWIPFHNNIRSCIQDPLNRDEENIKIKDLFINRVWKF